MKQYLLRQEIINDQDIVELDAKIKESVLEALEFAINSSYPKPEELLMIFIVRSCKHANNKLRRSLKGSVKARNGI
jgi:TPP-dependent pyruvate/acetoin dehydrogenase alpha subunit